MTQTAEDAKRRPIARRKFMGEGHDRRGRRSEHSSSLTGRLRLACVVPLAVAVRAAVPLAETTGSANAIGRGTVVGRGTLHLFCRASNDTTMPTTVMKAR